MARALDKGHILVVDDEETIVTVITDILTQAGYNALGALSGEEALDMYSVSPVDVVLTDIRMGGMDGFELMRHLKLMDKDLNIIVIAEASRQSRRSCQYNRSRLLKCQTGKRKCKAS